MYAFRRVGFLNTGTYVLVGSYLNASAINTRWISSAFLTASGLLILLLICHAIIARDPSASRKTLLVALTACIFIAQKSGESYHDYNGAVIACFFSVLLAALLWVQDGSVFRGVLLRGVLCSLLAATIFSATSLLATRLDYVLLKAWGGSRVYMTVAPHLAWIMTGMLTFGVAGETVANIAVNGKSAPPNWKLCIFALPLCVGFVLWANTNVPRDISLPRKDYVLFALAYMTILLSVPALFLSLVCTPVTEGRVAVLTAVVSLEALLLSLIDPGIHGTGRFWLWYAMNMTSLSAGLLATLAAFSALKAILRRLYVTDIESHGPMLPIKPHRLPDPA